MLASSGTAHKKAKQERRNEMAENSTTKREFSIHLIPVLLLVLYSSYFNPLISPFCCHSSKVFPLKVFSAASTFVCWLSTKGDFFLFENVNRKRECMKRELQNEKKNTHFHFSKRFFPIKDSIPPPPCHWHRHFPWRAAKICASNFDSPTKHDSHIVPIHFDFFSFYFTYTFAHRHLTFSFDSA